MTIASEITRINNNIAAAYTACNGKGATMPVTQNSANLATCISSISGGGGGGSFDLLNTIYTNRSGSSSFSAFYYNDEEFHYSDFDSNGYLLREWFWCSRFFTCDLVYPEDICGAYRDIDDLDMLSDVFGYGTNGVAFCPILSPNGNIYIYDFDSDVEVATLIPDADVVIHY